MHDQNAPSTSRRRFLGTTALGAAALGVPATIARGANETINVGLIGVGGRCRHLVGAIAKAGLPGVRLVAACDVYGPHLDAARALVDPKATFTPNYRELLGRKDVDAVLIASPDHWHVPLTIAALDAGKHVYVEKPLTHSLDEGKPVIDAAARAGKVVQVGMQQRSMPHIQRGYELVQSGRLGKIVRVHLTWNRNTDRARGGAQHVERARLDWKTFVGNATEQPFDAYRYRNWRWFWDFGGGIFTDLMVHWIDVAHWFLGVDHPNLATSVGTFNANAGLWETPDTVQTLLQYPGGVQVHFEGTFSNAREGAYIVFMGTDANLYIDRGRMELTPERGVGMPESMVLGSGRKGQDFYDKPDGEALHLANWLDAIAGRAAVAAPVGAGVSAASAAHLANASLREAKIVRL